MGESAINHIGAAFMLALAGCLLGGVEGDFAPLEAPSEPAATCHDGALNGGERDVDCGGGCSPCGVGQACRAHADCASGLCAGAACAPASCADAAQDGGESDVDCGGPCPGCADGAACATGGDCQSGVCSAGACAPASCGDGLHNGGEIDVDCGGACAPCALGMACTSDVDCQSGLCLGGVCAATCSDAILNQSETDLDCGGPVCPACPAASDCLVPNDCTSHVCTAGLCQGSTCSDGNKSGLETDVDCGGPDCAPCANGDACIYGEDCESGGCGAGVCGAWAKGYGGANVPAEFWPVVLSVDAAGDIAFASLHSPSLGFAALVKLSRAGGELWSRLVAAVWPRAVGSDGSGNVYLGGWAYSTDMGCGQQFEAGGTDAVVAKYHATTGACLWQKRFSTSNPDRVEYIAALPNGEAVIAGFFGSGTFQVGATTLTNNHTPSSGVQRYFLAKLDATGAVQWAKDVGDEVPPAAWYDETGGIALDPSGNIIVARKLSNVASPGTVDFGSPCSPLSPNDIGDVCIAKLDGAGTCVWANMYSSSGGDHAKDVATDGAGNVLFAGYAGAPIDFGGGPIPGGPNALVLAKLDGTTGAHLWSRTLDVAGTHAFPGAIASDAAGNAVVAGAFSFYADLGNGYVMNASTVTSCYACADIFVAKYAASTGNHLFSTTYGVDADDFAYDVALSPLTESVIVTGSFKQTLDLGAAVPLVPVSPHDAFVLSMGRLP